MKLGTGTWTLSAALGDINVDGHLDIVLGNSAGKKATFPDMNVVSLPGGWTWTLSGCCIRRCQW